MRAKSDYRLSEDPEDQKLEIEQALIDIALALDGTIREFTPTLYGSATAGTFTYTTASTSGWYLRQTQVVDYCFSVVWTGKGTAAGDLQMSLPSKVWFADTDFWVGSLISSSVSFANASDTYCVPVAVSNSYDCEFVSGRHNAASGKVQVQTAGSLVGHVRYMGQVDK